MVPANTPVRSIFVAVILVAISVAAPSHGIEAETVIRNVTIVDVTDGSLVPEAAVAIAGPAIVFAGPADEFNASTGAQVIDGAGGYVIPGLWDAHVHSVTARPWHFPLLIAHGVTSVRNMHTTEENPLDTVLRVKAEIASGEIVGPRFLANGAIIAGPAAIWPQSISVATADEARAAVDAMVDGGADFLKLYDSIPAEAFHALAARARERGIPFDGHTVTSVGPIESARAGQRTFEHASGVHVGCAPRTEAVVESEAKMYADSPFPQSQFHFFEHMTQLADLRSEVLCRETAQAYLDAGSSACPTLVNTRSMVNATVMVADEVAMGLLPPAIRGQWRGMAQDELSIEFAKAAEPLWRTAQSNVRLLHEMGVPLIAGTDIGNPFLVPGHSLLTELELLVSVGLTPLEALQSATINPATVFGIENCGQVDTGFEADLVVLAQNPLDDISFVRTVAMVVLDGRVFDADALEAMKESVASME